MAANWVLLILIPALCCAEDLAKPACTGKNRGELWPDSKGRVLDSCTPIEICTHTAARYKWKQLTAHVSQLSKGSKGICAPARPALMPELTEADRAADLERPAINVNSHEKTTEDLENDNPPQRKKSP
jgi:hypothetical protein